ncbi:MAG: carbohydrate ABC transporter permease [Vampirovibrionales bacterium]
MQAKNPWLTYLGRTFFILVAVMPFLWMLSTSFKGSEEALFTTPPQWVPLHPTLEHYVKVWQALPMLQFFVNSLVVTTLASFGNVLNAVLAGIALSRFDFKGKTLFFGLIFATMFVPFEVLMIPLYKSVLQLGLTARSGMIPLWIGLALPFCVSGFGILMVKDAVDNLPPYYEEAALLDGASLFQRIFGVIMPLIQPTLVTLTIFSFIAVWGDFLWASLLTNEPQTLTLTTGLVQLQGQFSSDWRQISAGTVLMLLPSLLFFGVMQRYLIQSQGGAKG